MAFPSRGYKIIIDNPKNAVFKRDPINWDLRWAEWNHGQVLRDPSKSRGLLATFANTIARVQGYVKSVEYVEHNGNEQSQITLTNVYLLLHEGNDDECIVFYQHINVYVPVAMRTFYVHLNQQVYFSGKITKYHRSQSAVTKGSTELAFSIGMPVEAVHFGQYKRLAPDCVHRTVIGIKKQTDADESKKSTCDIPKQTMNPHVESHSGLYQEPGRHYTNMRSSDTPHQKPRLVVKKVHTSSSQGLYQETRHHPSSRQNANKLQEASTTKGNKFVKGIGKAIDIGLGIYNITHPR